VHEPGVRAVHPLPRAAGTYRRGRQTRAPRQARPVDAANAFQLHGGVRERSAISARRPRIALPRTRTWNSSRTVVWLLMRVARNRTASGRTPATLPPRSRDTTFNEDTSTFRAGTAPHTMTIIHNTLIAAFRPPDGTTPNKPAGISHTPPADE
jgi:hypothetical protein